MPYCTKCGNVIEGNSIFCPKCGQSIEQSPQAPQNPQQTIVFVQSPHQTQVRSVAKSKGVALLLCFFLGGLGVHQFYLGNTAMGVAYLLFSWTCIPELISIIDFFVLLCMNEAYFHGKYDPK